MIMYTINLKTLIMALALFVAAESLALERAAAQLAPSTAPVSPAPAAALPASYVAHNTAVKPSRPPQTPTSQTNAAAQQHDQTKVVRIYGGAGYFDNALAEELRPVLVKAFPSSRPDAPKAVPAAVAAPAKGESQSKLTLAAHL
jgi:hypothetical protein